MGNNEKQKVLLGPSSFGAMDDAPLKRLRDAGFELIDNPYKRKLTRQELMELLPGVVGIIAGLEPLDRDVMERSALKVISRVGSGISNVDLDAARELGVIVRYTPYGPTTAVAELTLGALLNLLRHISLMDSALHRGKWSKKIGAQLAGRTALVVGFGRIGQKVASLLGAFGVTVLASDPAYTGNIDGVEAVSLTEGLGRADLVLLHTSGEETLIGAEEFKLMKDGAYLLNAARGGLVDEDALLAALKGGRLAGAWLDTFSHEPYEGPLAECPQVVLTPHVGSYTLECRRSMEMEAAENLINAFKEL